MRIGRIGQHFQRAFHPPFGHALARMLAGVEPDLFLAAAHFEAVDRLPLQAVAENADGYAFDCSGFRDQVVMAFHAIGSEIGKPDDIAACRVANRQGAAFLVIAARCARPIVAVFADTGVIIGPALGIGRFI